MKNELTKVIKSGKDEDKRSYNVTVLCSGMTPEQAQEDAFHYYVWKIQRVIRDATETQKSKWAKEGLTMHYTEVGKKVEAPEEVVGKMSDEQALQALAALQARFGAITSKGRK